MVTMMPWLVQTMFSEGFDEVTIPETKLNGVAMLENVSECGSACKESGNYNHLHFS